MSSAASDPPVRCLPESPSVLRRLLPRVSQRQCGDGAVAWEFNCEVVELSFSHFEKCARFYHPTPPFSRLFMIEEGLVLLECGKGLLRLEAGMFHLLPANYAFTAEYTAGTRIKGFHLHLFDGVGFPLAADLPGVESWSDPPGARAMRERIDAGNEPAIHAMLLVVLGALAPYWQRRAARRAAMPRIYRDILAALDGPAPARLRLEELARRYHLSREALSKGFLRHVGIPFKEYLLDLILERARDWLVHTELSAGEIAARLGYANENYFFRIFHSRIGMTPMAYRRCFVPEVQL